MFFSRAKYFNRLGIFAGAALILLTAQPLRAADRQVTGVKIDSIDDGIELKLKTEGQKNNQPSFFTFNRGKKLEANILNTELQLEKGKSFRKENPYPGIANIEVSRVDKNNIRVVVEGEKNAPGAEVLQREAEGIILSLRITGSVKQCTA